MTTQFLIAGSGAVLGLGVAFLSVGIAILAQTSKPKKHHAYIFLILAVIAVIFYTFLWYLALNSVSQDVSGTTPQGNSLIELFSTNWRVSPYWLTAIGTIALAVVTVIIAVFMPRWRKPRFTFEFANEQPYCRTATPLSQPSAKSYWLRLRIVNSGKSVAKRCIGKLVAIMDDSGNRLNDHDPAMLHWVGTDWEAIPFKPIDLNQGEDEYLDLFYVIDTNPNLALICQDKYPRGTLNYLVPGVYRICVTIYADNASPSTSEYRLVFGGSVYTNIRLEDHV